MFLMEKCRSILRYELTFWFIGAVQGPSDEDKLIRLAWASPSVSGLLCVSVVSNKDRVSQN